MVCAKTQNTSSGTTGDSTAAEVNVQHQTLDTTRQSNQAINAKLSVTREETTNEAVIIREETTTTTKDVPLAVVVDDDSKQYLKLAEMYADGLLITYDEWQKAKKDLDGF